VGFYDLVTNQMILAGGIFYALSFFAYIFALRFLPLSLAQPVITAGVSAITVISAAIFFHEALSLANWIGLVTICVGIFLLFYGRTII
jgi:multidrug transporter EmrE-like cation transporter